MPSHSYISSNLLPSCLPLSDPPTPRYLADFFFAQLFCARVFAHRCRFAKFIPVGSYGRSDQSCARWWGELRSLFFADSLRAEVSFQAHSPALLRGITLFCVDFATVLSRVACTKESGERVQPFCGWQIFRFYLQFNPLKRSFLKSLSILSIIALYWTSLINIPFSPNAVQNAKCRILNDWLGK